MKANKSSRKTNGVSKSSKKPFKAAKVISKGRAPKAHEPRMHAGEKTGVVSSVSERITTLEALLSACSVDSDYWMVKDYLINKWEQGMDDGEGGILIRPLFQIKANLVKQPGLDEMQKIANAFRSQSRTYSQPVLKLQSAPREGSLYEINVADLHIGKLAWGEETGDADYDSKVACNLFEESIQSLIAKAPKTTERILLPVGNDFLNVDSMSRETTGGTPQDEDGRWQKTFTTAVNLLSKSIDYLVRTAPVDIIIVPGNHDTQRGFYLGEVLRNRYHTHKLVSVDNTPKLRKYYAYGKNLLGFTHGDKEKIGILPLLMATECQGAWGSYNYREWHLGHLHTEIIRENNGVIIRNLSSLSSADAWHANNGYKGNTRKAEAFTYRATGGLVSKTSHIVK